MYDYDENKYYSSDNTDELTDQLEDLWSSYSDETDEIDSYD